MSTQGGGAVTGLVVGCLGLGLYLAGKGTVLAAKGVMLVGKGLHDAYREHESRVEERLKKKEEGLTRLKQLDEALTAVQAQFRDSEGRLEKSNVNKPIDFEWTVARALSQHKKKIIQENAIAERLKADLETATAKLDALQEQRAPLASSAQTPASTVEHIDQEQKTLQGSKKDLEARFAAYSSLHTQLDEEFRSELLADAEKILAILPQPHVFESRLQCLRTGGTVEDSKRFLDELYQERRRLKDAQDAKQTQTPQLTRRLLGSRLIAENLRCLADTEREALLSDLAFADEQLDRGEMVEAEIRVTNIEARLDDYRKRDIEAWIREEKTAKDALRGAGSLIIAMEEDEGMRQLLRVQQKEEQFKSHHELLEKAHALLVAGGFQAAAGVANDLTEKLSALRDDVLSTENETRIKALVEVAQQAMTDRGFVDVRASRERKDWCILGQRGATSFWVSIHDNGALEFDLGKEGFSSQAECWAEIEAFLETLRAKGVHLDMRFSEPTLDPGNTQETKVQEENLVATDGTETTMKEAQQLEEKE